MNTATTTSPSVSALAAAVAAQMIGWKLGETSLGRDQGDQWAHIVHAGGGEISISLKSHPKACLHVSGVWPRRPNGAWGEFMPRDADRASYSINVGLGKTPAQIARDIARRLEGPYLTEYARLAERMRATIAAEGGAAEAAARIAASIGGKAQKGQGDNHTIWLADLFDGRRGHGDLKVSPAGEGEPAYVDLELRGITPDEAVLILKLLRDGLEGTAVAALIDTTKEHTPHA